MIRFLQTDSRFTKALFIVVIAAASVGMVVYLIPGLYSLGTPSSGTYAVIYPHWYSRFISSGATVSQQQVQVVAQQTLETRSPEYANNPIIVRYYEAQVGAQLVQQQVLLQVAGQLGIHVSNSDLRTYLHSGNLGAALFPNGKFIGQQAYADLIASRLNMSVKQFETEARTQIAINRLEALITAPVTVSDKTVRNAYLKQNTKIKIEYAVLSAQQLRSQINPSDAVLEAYFKQNAARYATAIPEERTIAYFAFTPNDLPGGIPQPTQQQIEQYYNDHKSQYMTPAEAESRHILIAVSANASPQAVAAAKAKAEMILKKIQNGASFAAMARKYSDDPGSKDKGGQLGFVTKGTMVPTFDHAIFTQPIGKLTIVRSVYGFHVVQVEARKPAQLQPINQVLPEIQVALIRNQTAAEETKYAQELTNQADKEGLAKTAAAHHLQLVTTKPVAQQGMISTLPDSAHLLAKAFAVKPGDPPQSAATGEGYAIFQVTEINPAHPPTFAEWKANVLSDYRDGQLPTLISNATQELASKAQSMNSIAKAAKAMGATVETSGLVTEYGQVPNMGQVGQVAPQLFNLKVGNISGPIATQTGGIVAKVVDKQLPTPAEIAKNFDQTRETLLQQRRNDAFNIFVSTMVQNYQRHGLIRLGKLPGQNNQGT